MSKLGQFKLISTGLTGQQTFVIEQEDIFSRFAQILINASDVSRRRCRHRCRRRRRLHLGLDLVPVSNINQTGRRSLRLFLLHLIQMTAPVAN